MKITASDLLELELVDEVGPEPLGGAHNDHEAMADTLKDVLLKNLEELEKIDPAYLAPASTPSDQVAPVAETESRVS